MSDDEKKRDIEVKRPVYATMTSGIVVDVDEKYARSIRKRCYNADLRLFAVFEIESDRHSRMQNLETRTNAVNHFLSKIEEDIAPITEQEYDQLAMQLWTNSQTAGALHIFNLKKHLSRRGVHYTDKVIENLEKNTSTKEIVMGVNFLRKEIKEIGRSDAIETHYKEKKKRQLEKKKREQESQDITPGGNTPKFRDPIGDENE